MTPEQQTFFREQGYLRLQRCLAHSRVAPLKRRILDQLNRLGTARGGKVPSRPLRDMPPFQQVGKLGQLIKIEDLAATLINETVRQALRSLSPHPLAAPAAAQLLLSLPNQGEWRLDGLNWHVDIAAAPGDPVPGIQVFALIDDVLPRGGATLAIAGSHRLQAGKFLAGRNIRQLLREAPDFGASLQEAGLSLLEMSGRAGDVYLMDMRTLHTPSINATRAVRMMATVRCHRR